MGVNPKPWRTCMALTILLFLGSAVAIYLACEYFVNGVEWVGQRLNMGQTATGTILAAFGTALPESVVTLVAVVFGTNAAEKDIGVGAALGGPLALSTLAYSVVGLTLLGSRTLAVRRKSRLDVDTKRLSRDPSWFLGLFIFKIGLGLIAFAWKPWLGILFLLAYGLYIRQEMAGGAGAAEEEGETEPLTFARHAEVPGTGIAMLQTSLALIVIFLASRLFVAQLGALGPALGLEPQLLALLLSPIATELPETMNAIIWVRQGKYRLALANISGAMMIQATIPTAFGLIWTPWLLTPPLLVAAGVTALAIAVMVLAFRRGMVSRGLLAWMGLLYLLFAALLILLHLR